MSEDEQTVDNGLVSGDGVTMDAGGGATDSTISAKEAERRRIQAQIEEFLKGGGQITQVDTNVMADPPKRPESNYGGQPI